MMRRAALCMVVWIGVAALGIVCDEAFAQLSAPAGSDRPVDDARANRAGIRKLVGRHLTLYTDLPSDAEVDRLPDVFDAAVPQWAAYFNVPLERTAGWSIRGYLIGDRRRFDSLGLMPREHDNFAHGLVIGSELWLHEQPTPYYRRHLLLHEGTHAFMAHMLGGCGPGWYMEGTAELLGTHGFDEKSGRLTLGIMPASRDEVPMLGRIKLVQDAFAADRALLLPSVMRLDNRRQMDNEGYAWCWAAAKFLDAHPRYQQRFRQLYRHVQEPGFNDLVRQTYADDWSDLVTEWRAFVSTIAHGYDFERMAIDFERGQPLAEEGREVTIAADRGWQSSGAWLDAGHEYLVTAEGRFQIASDPTDDGTRPWWCEPGGVTIEYEAGRPLGMLLGAIDARDAGQPASPTAEAGLADENADAEEVFADESHSGLSEPFAIGLERTITPPSSGTLYLRVNDSAGKLSDNEGSVTVTIAPAASENSNGQ